MARKSAPAVLQDPAIVERHAAPIGEVVLVRSAEHRGFLDVQFVTPRPDGTFDRRSLLLMQGTVNRVARRMMDLHSGICAAQHAAAGTRR